MTLVAALAAVGKALGAEGTLAIEAEVIDLRPLSPFGAGIVAGSAAPTGRLVVVDRPPLGGYAGEQFAAAAGAGPVRARRVTSPDVPIPASRALGNAALTSAEQIADAAPDLLGAAAGVAG